MCFSRTLYTPATAATPDARCSASAPPSARAGSQFAMARGAGDADWKLNFVFGSTIITRNRHLALSSFIELDRDARDAQRGSIKAYSRIFAAARPRLDSRRRRLAGNVLAREII